jgi:hypothetical protein
MVFVNRINNKCQPNFLISDTRVSIPEVKRTECEVDHFWSCVRVKNEWSCISIPLNVFLVFTVTTLPISTFLILWQLCCLGLSDFFFVTLPIYIALKYELFIVTQTYCPCDSAGISSRSSQMFSVTLILLPHNPVEISDLHGTW